MTQELIELRNSILEGRYADALVIVDELEGMSKQAILRNIQSYLNILLIHLMKNQIEQRLTDSWVNSIRNSLKQIKKLNIKDNKKSYYINKDDWETFIEEEVIEDAIADASLEVFNGKYTRSQLSTILDRKQILTTTTSFLALTYIYSAKELPAIMDDYLAQLLPSRYKITYLLFLLPLCPWRLGGSLNRYSSSGKGVVGGEDWINRKS